MIVRRVSEKADCDTCPQRGTCSEILQKLTPLFQSFSFAIGAVVLPYIKREKTLTANMSHEEMIKTVPQVAQIVNLLKETLSEVIGILAGHNNETLIVDGMGLLDLDPATLPRVTDTLPIIRGGEVVGTNVVVSTTQGYIGIVQIKGRPCTVKPPVKDLAQHMDRMQKVIREIDAVLGQIDSINAQAKAQTQSGEEDLDDLPW